jgi:uncharacterized protein (TIRG00374 family)
VRAKLAAWLGVMVSVAVLGYLVAQFDVAGAIRALGMAEVAWALPAALVYLALFPLRGLRWSLLMGSVRAPAAAGAASAPARVPVGVATEVFVVGAMANNVMPARLGDVARAFVLSRRAGVPATATLANVLLERILDGLVVVGFLSVVLVIAPPEAAWVTSVGVSMAAVFVAALSGCALLAWNQRRALGLLVWLLRPFPGLAERVHPRVALLVEGLAVLREARRMAVVLALSLGIWTLEVAVYALAQRAFGLELPWSGLCLVMAVLTLGLTAPSAPGFVGVFEGLIVAAVALYGVGDEIALAFALTMHLIHYVPVTVLGLFYAWRSGLRIRELGATRATPAPEGA